MVYKVQNERMENVYNKVEQYPGEKLDFVTHLLGLNDILVNTTKELVRRVNNPCTEPMYNRDIKQAWSDS
jgi:hypothetical protein